MKDFIVHPNPLIRSGDTEQNHFSVAKQGQ